MNRHAERSEASQNATASHSEILRRAAPAQDDGGLASFAETGIAFPVPVLDAAELAHFRDEYAHLVEASGGALTRFEFAHAKLPWAYDLATHPRVLDAVAEVIGGDIVVWGTLILSKPPNDDKFIAWHQDGAYAEFLGDAPSISAWIALSDSTAESGCMRVVPGSQTRKLAHAETHHPLNLLDYGHEIAAEVDEAEAVDVELRAGEMSLHHIDIVHGSKPNRASWWRTGFIVRYTTPRMLRARYSVVAARGRRPEHLGALAARP